MPENSNLTTTWNYTWSKWLYTRGLQKLCHIRQVSSSHPACHLAPPSRRLGGKEVRPEGQSLGAGRSRNLHFICLRAKGNGKECAEFHANELIMYRGPGWELQGGIKGGWVSTGGKRIQECVLKAQNQKKGMEASAISSSPRLGSYTPNWVFTLPEYISLGSLGHLKRPQHVITRGPISSFAH